MLPPQSAGSEVESLAALARAGDREAFAALYERFGAGVKGYLCYAASRDVAEDLAQETFCRALQYIHLLRDPIKFAPWLMQIARNVFRRWVAVKAAGPELVGGLEALADRLPGDLAAVSAGMAESEDHMTAVKILRLLPEIYLLPLYLHYVEELSMAEIAEVSGYPVSTIKWRLHRGLELCRLHSHEHQIAARRQTKE